MSMDGFRPMLHVECGHDDYNKPWWLVRWSSAHWYCERMVHDIFAVVYSSEWFCCVVPVSTAHKIQESAPARYRGLLISVFQIWTSIGSLVGTVIDNATHAMPGRMSYIIPLSTIYIVPVLMSIGLLFIPESPRWLMLMERPALAEKSMLWMRPDPSSVAEELAEIQAAIDAEKAVKETANFMDIWRDPVDRRRTLLAIAAVSTQAASGAMFMIAYGTYFFQMANVGSPFMNACILTAVGVFAIMVNSCIISSIGRRRVFLMSGLTLCGITQIVVAAVYHVNPGTVQTGKVCYRCPRIAISY